MPAPAGWYDDGAGRLRYWDGSAWTAHTAPHPPQMPPPASQLMPSRPPAIVPYPAHPVPARPVAARPANGPGVAGFVVGLVSVFLPFVFGLVAAIAGLVLSVVGLTRPAAGKGLAVAGLVLSILGLLLIF